MQNQSPALLAGLTMKNNIPFHSLKYEKCPQYHSEKKKKKKRKQKNVLVISHIPFSLFIF